MKKLTVFFAVIALVSFVIIVSTAQAEDLLPKGQWTSFFVGTNKAIMYKGTVTNLSSTGTLVTEYVLLVRDNTDTIAEFSVKKNELFYVGSSVYKITGTTLDSLGVRSLILLVVHN
ncbi:MAG TPA: hypothetical protein PLK35_00990 [Candidatus Moranbacteria bacterium]|nr:hypothetical protein [Candidatus Moranbacteria bacterium]